MKPEEQRIAIAEWCGWKRREWAYVVQLPNYLNDLNAMHEAEKKLKTFEQTCRYRDALFNACGLNPLYWCDAGTPAPEFVKVATATAAQRAEALLRTIGKWKE